MKTLFILSVVTLLIVGGVLYATEHYALGTIIFWVGVYVGAAKIIVKQEKRTNKVGS